MKRLCVFVFTLVLSGVLQAGVVYEIETKEHRPPGGVSETLVTSDGNNLKMAIVNTGRNDKDEMIYRGQRREMLIVDHGEKGYFVIDQATADQIAGRVNQAMSQFQSMLDSVPPERRAMVEQMMKQRMPTQQTQQKPTTQLNKTSERETLKGYPCVKYELLRAGRKTHEFWVTSWDKVEGGYEIAQSFQGMAKLMRAMKDTFTKGAGMGGGDDSDENPFAYMGDFDGFPVVTKEFASDGSLESESWLRSASRRSIDPDAFEPPAGYQRRQMGGGF